MQNKISLFFPSLYFYIFVYVYIYLKYWQILLKTRNLCEQAYSISIVTVTHADHLGNNSIS